MTFWLLASFRWYRETVQPDKPRKLDHTKLRGKARAVYPVTRFTKAECASYLPATARAHHKPYPKAKRYKRWGGKRGAIRCEAERLVTGIVISLSWCGGRWAIAISVSFGSFTRDHQGRWQFAEKPKRRDKPVPPSFKAEWKRLHKLPAFRPPREMGKVEGASFDWKPERQHYFGAWEQHRFVRWTPTPKPIVTDFSPFLGGNSFLQHKVEGITPTIRNDTDEAQIKDRVSPG